MQLDTSLLWTFFLVFLRCSALFIAAPIFSAQNFPPRVRIYFAVILAMSLTGVVKPNIGSVPESMPELVLKASHELLVGVLIGSLFHLLFQAIQMAGSLMDTQIGLGMSTTMNPVTGVQVTIISQFKYLLSTVIFLVSDGHHTMLHSLISSYKAAGPGDAISIQALSESTLQLLATFSILAIQIAAPIIAVSLVVDAALGLVSRAVPQMQVFLVGMPAKTIAGLTIVAFTLPALVSGVHSGVGTAADAVMRALGN